MAQKKQGKVVAYVGAMNCGKTKKLVEIYRYFLEDKKEVAVYKPMLDKNEKQNPLVSSRNKDFFAPAYPVSSLGDILRDAEKYKLDIVLIDEIQMFQDTNIGKFLESLVLQGITVYIFGLDLNSDGEPFGNMGAVLCHADEVIKLNGTCKCGQKTRISKYKHGKKPQEILVGDLDVYEPVCKECFYKFTKPNYATLNKTITEQPLIFEYRDNGFIHRFRATRKQLEELGYTIEQVKNMKDVLEIHNLIMEIKEMNDGEQE